MKIRFLVDTRVTVKAGNRHGDFGRLMNKYEVAEITKIESLPGDKTNLHFKNGMIYLDVPRNFYKVVGT